MEIQIVGIHSEIQIVEIHSEIQIVEIHSEIQIVEIHFEIQIVEIHFKIQIVRIVQEQTLNFGKIKSSLNIIIKKMCLRNTMPPRQP